jgi:deoxyadenosine/deoxycytidine kinase
MTTNELLIGIVGPCGAGKTTLEAGLKNLGYNARAVVQEHSYVPDMWQRLTKPDLLVFLQASHEVCARRRRFEWTPAEWQEQQHRLRHARQHAAIFVDTDALDAGQVLSRVLQSLETLPASGD